MSGTRISDIGVFAFANGLPGEMQRLTVSVGNSQVGSEAPAKFAAAPHRKLESLTLWQPDGLATASSVLNRTTNE